MKRIIIALSAILIGSTGSCQNNAQFKPIAVIELFTSEGCSSCPPADNLVAKLVDESAKSKENVFVLSFHVDYWNRLGWKDSFSSHQYSERQNTYASQLNLPQVYTPQIIVNGKHELVGSDESKLHEDIEKVMLDKSQTCFTRLTAHNAQGAIEVEYQLAGEIDSSLINFALISLKESTEVKSGENGGHRLNHVHVVRQLITRPADKTGKVIFNNLPSTGTNNLAVIAYVQRKNNFKITGAAQAVPQ